jgi:hypothetical protein
VSFEITWVSIGVLASILLHAYHTVKWCTRISINLESLSTNLLKMDKELEKRDTQILAIWKKVDMIGNRLTAVESKCSIEHKDY